jgi:ATP-dependent exoDNAse (exonuclease V) beta subunit
MLHGTLGDVPLTTLRLTANFRSQSHLVDAFNQDFTRIFPAEPDPAQPDLVAYLPAQAARPPRNKPARVWHAAPLPYSDDPEICAAQESTQRHQTAQEIRRQIEQWRARPLPNDRTEPWKIAVLVRTRTHLIEIVQALKLPEQIPYRAVEIEPLAERQEILDLLALSRALLHPADRTAWLALLRAPWCGLTLADVHTLAGSDDLTLRSRTVFDLIESRGDLLSEDGIARLTPFYTVMQAALAQRSRLPLAEWVERTWRTFDAHRFLSPEELENAARLFTLLDQLELPGGRLDLETLTARLKRLFAAPSVHAGAVDLMTMHGAKGLEWDVVFLPALERTAQDAHTRLLNWLEVDPSRDPDGSVAPGILSPIQSKGAESLELNRWMRGIESTREAAERKRLFYVACTRAREELHLFAAPARKKDGRFNIPKNSLLHAAWNAAEEHFADHLLAPILAMPTPATKLPDVLDLAASQEANGSPTRTIWRIPLILSSHAPLPHLLAPEFQPTPLFERPEGSFAARAFGNAVHAFLEQLALRRAAGQTIAELTRELSTWLPRIIQTLRASGLAPVQIERLAARVLAALRNTLTDAGGQWILTPHPEAATEFSLTFADDGPSTLRMDRTFLAGPELLSTGLEALWIVDYKTAHLGGREREGFLAEERAKYAAQMQTYADALRSGSHPAICLALYYPLLPALIVYDPAPRPVVYSSS